MGRKKQDRPTATFYLKNDSDRTADKEGKYPIYIRYYVNRRKVVRSLNVWVKESDWDSVKQRVLSTDNQHSRINKIIDRKKTEIDGLLLDFDGRLTPEILGAMLDGIDNADGKEKDIDFIQ